MDYAKALAPWRCAIRTKLVECVKSESKAVACLQRTIRTPWLDTYFVYTSYLGTDSFFLLVLPTFFFFGYDDFGRGLLMILALGGYASSSCKDLFCSPRPFSPPVTRLTLRDHHLEYGFPSTHTTQSSSIAFYFLLYCPVYPITPTYAYPVDPCPCFDDSVASGSVALGALLGRWGVNYFVMNGVLRAPAVTPTRSWWVIAALKMFTGMSAILSWRLLAKAALSPILRLVWGREVGTSKARINRCKSYVLTKVVVYAGIAILACDILPAVFSFLDWA
ncbi:hypothetical protein IW261DRAFT_1564852 [Armillaria novae-zelandiae]|uniref:Phosphatidic acid phosphatase type 2/haloperoxidase domain-containing protein n=1 Tax=Armillaria novae-zelandiae TaxID=153914 RepID=A0AA39P7B1_9AGAR|nr:hypothetical protein IW261DRAFT_1564852 [Armillaria novae-zelandiae]